MGREGGGGWTRKKGTDIQIVESLANFLPWRERESKKKKLILMLFPFLLTSAHIKRFIKTNLGVVATVNVRHITFKSHKIAVAERACLCMFI